MKQYKLNAGDPIIYWLPGEREGRFGRVRAGQWPKMRSIHSMRTCVELKGNRDPVDVDHIAPVTGFAVSGEEHWHECATYGDAERYIMDIGAKDVEILAITVDEPEQVVGEIEFRALPDFAIFVEQCHEAQLSDYVLDGYDEPPRWLAMIEGARHPEAGNIWNDVMRDAVAEFLRRCEVRAERLHRIDRTGEGATS